MTAAVQPADGGWLRAAFDAAPVTMLVVDAEGRVLFANAQAEAAFGHSRSDLGAMRLDALLALDTPSSWGDDLAAFLAAPLTPALPPRRDLFGRGKAGARFPVEISLAHLGAGHGAMAVVVIRDLAEQKDEEARQAAVTAEAREERARLEALLEFAPAFIIGINNLGKIDFINRTLPQHAKKDVIGSSWLQYFPPEHQTLMEHEMAAAYATESTRIFETVTPGPDGGDLWFESHLAPIRVDRQIMGAVLVSQDISERKRTHAELLAGRQMALLGTLAAGVAHEINTPIQFVGDSVQFLRGAAGDLLVLLDKLQELRRAALAGTSLDEAIAAAMQAEADADLPYLRENIPTAFDRCVDGLNRVGTIVRSLKDFAHPSDKDRVAVDLNRAIESTLTIATGEYKYVARVETDLGELPPVVCYATEICQAVLNIVVNAAHAIGDVVAGTGRKGLITVRTRREGDSVVISIADTGAGIPEKIRSRIFDPFFTTKEIGKGTGQGLAIAWSAVKERHGGDLTFETRVGEGTTFFIRLPVAGKESTA